MPITTPQVRDVKFERFKASGKAVSLPAKCVAFAESTKDNRLLVAMVAAPSMVAKGIAAMMRSQHDFQFHVTDFGVSKRFEGDYRVAISRLPGYSMAQVLIVADTQALLIGPVQDALWRYLMSDRISTPLLREWLPQIHAELERWAKIIGTNGFGCEANVANFETDVTDRIVKELLRKRKVFI